MPTRATLSNLHPLYSPVVAKQFFGSADVLEIDCRVLLDAVPRSKWAELLSNLPDTISHVKLQIQIKEDELKDLLKALPPSVTEISLSFWIEKRDYHFSVFFDSYYTDDFEALYSGKPAVLLSLFPAQIEKIHLLDTSLYFTQSTHKLCERDDLQSQGFSTEKGKSLSIRDSNGGLSRLKLNSIHLSSKIGLSNYTAVRVSARLRSVDAARVVMSYLDEAYSDPDHEIMGSCSHQLLQALFRRTEVVGPKRVVGRVVLNITPNGRAHFSRRVFEPECEAGFNESAEYWKPDVRPLVKSLNELGKYGIQLKNAGDVEAGSIAQNLADQLLRAIDKYEQCGRNDPDFKESFLKLLHSQDAKMPSYRHDWRVILMNIAIALTGVGLLLVAGKLISTRGAAGFFAETKAHGIRTEAEKGLTRLVPVG